MRLASATGVTNGKLTWRSWPQSLFRKFAKFSISKVTMPRVLRKIGNSCAKRRSRDVTQGLRWELRGMILPRHFSSPSSWM